MVSILKKPVGSSKGVIAFTHKERHLLNEDAPIIGPEVRRLRQRYLTAMHWGWFADAADHPPYVDVHIAREDTVRFRGPVQPRTLPFNSSLFTPEYFRVRPEVPKHWDIIAVTRTVRFKNTDQLLECLRMVLDRRPQTRALVVCVGPTGTPKGHHNGLAELYEQLFDSARREQVSFNYVRSNGLFPLSRRDIAFLYNASRVFTLFSDREGGSKVIKEAMLCGLPVVAKAHLQGGGRQLFDDRNSRVFRSLAEGADCFVDLLDNWEQVEVDAEHLAREASEVYTVPKFEQALRALLEELDGPVEGEFDLHDLGRRLPSHVPHEVHESLRDHDSSDIKSREAMVRYIRHLLDGQPVHSIQLSPAEKAMLRVQMRTEELERLALAVRRRVGV